MNIPGIGNPKDLFGGRDSNSKKDQATEPAQAADDPVLLWKEAEASPEPSAELPPEITVTPVEGESISSSDPFATFVTRQDPGRLAFTGTVGVITLLSWIFKAAYGALWITLVAILLTVVFAILLPGMFAQPLKEAKEMEAKHVSQSVSLYEVDPRIKEALTAKDPATPELVLWQGRRHPMSLWLWWFAFAGFNALVIAVVVAAGSWKVSKIVLVVWAVGMLVLAARVFLWRHDVIAITTTRVLEADGILSSNVRSMALAKLTDCEKHIPWHSKLLAWLRFIYIPYGTIRLETAGQNQALEHMRFLPGVDARYVLITGQTSA